MKKKYIFYSSYFDIETLRSHTLSLNEKNIEFNVVNKASHHSSKAPLSISFEADLEILDTDFEKADKILCALNEEV